MKCELCYEDIELITKDHWLVTIRQHTTSAQVQFFLHDRCERLLLANLNISQGTINEKNEEK